MIRKRTSEDITLLISYLSLIGIWFAIPSVSLLLNRDHRWKIAALLLSTLVILLIIAYVLQWEALFPPSAALNTSLPQAKESYTLADYDKIKWCKCRGKV